MGPMEFIPCFLDAFKGHNVHIQVCGDSHADRAMNRVANDFIRSDCDELVIIDIDITFTGEQLRRLLEHDVPLVYGIYPKKEPATNPCLCGFPDELLRDQLLHDAQLRLLPVAADLPLAA